MTLDSINYFNCVFYCT